MKPFILITSLLVFVLGGIFLLMPNTPPPKLPQCLAQGEWYDKTYASSNTLHRALTHFKKGNYILKPSIKRAHFMPSAIPESFSWEPLFKTLYTTFPKAPLKSPITLSIELIENDKHDPKKQSKTCQLAAGHLMIGFFDDTKPLYRLYIEYHQHDLSDVPKRIMCALEAFEYHTLMP